MKLYEEEGESFNNINYATTMSQLGRIASLDRQDPSFIAYLEDLSDRMEQLGLSWIGVQGTANILHAIGKMQLKNQHTEKIVEFAVNDSNSEWLVRNGKPQAIANAVWACAKLDFKPLALCQEVEKRSKWLVREGNAQDLANTVWAFAKLMIQAPSVFRS
jgi:hypothetical protein